MLRSHIESAQAGTQVSVGVSVDFDRKLPALSPGTVAQSGTAWDTAAWDTFQWSSGLARHRAWRGIAAKGAAISVHLISHTSAEQVSLFSSGRVHLISHTSAENK